MALEQKDGTGVDRVNCSPSEIQVNTLSGGGDLVVTAGGTATATTAAFTGCQ